MLSRPIFVGLYISNNLICFCFVIFSPHVPGVFLCMFIIIIVKLLQKEFEAWEDDIFLKKEFMFASFQDNEDTNNPGSQSNF